MNMAQGVGLHRDLSGPAVTAFSMEIRRRVWWTLFIVDSGMRLTFGRPTLSLGGISTKLPRNLNDNDLAVDLAEIPQSRGIPTITSCLIWQTKLAKIGNMGNVKLVEKHLPDQSTMLALGDEVVQWVASLPNYMSTDYENPEFEMYTEPRMKLHWRSMHLRIIIHRPFLLDLMKQRKSLEFSDPKAPASCCFYAAEECITSILSFLSEHTSRHGSLIWYGCYWLVTAVLVHVTCLLYEPQHEMAMSWRQVIENVQTTLKCMGPFEPLAMRAAQVVERIMSKV
jgi:transcriptional regulatory protein GAL4